MMLNKIKIFLLISMVLVLTIHTDPGLTLNLADIAKMSSPETAITLVTISEPSDQHALKPKRDSFLSTFPLPQPQWQRINFPILPPPRTDPSLTLNPINKIGLLFGGYNSSTGILNDLWITNGQMWMQFQTPHSPTARASASMAYDEARQEAILFGGNNNVTLLGDTWLFNGVDWIQQQPLASPSPREVASMAYDADRKATILFGGLADTGGKYWDALSEMWIWDGQNWQQQFSTPMPPARFAANMVYDRAHKSIVLFGGAIGGGFRDDTWLWDGTSWIEQHPLHHPTGRANFGMAYDETRQQVILFGGQTFAYANPTETWSWDGQDWTQLPTRQAPPKELASAAQLVYLPDLQTVILYNDFREKTIVTDANFTITERSEVWTLAYRYFIYMPIIPWQ